VARAKPADLVTIRELGEQVIAGKKSKRSRTVANAEFYIRKWIVPWFDEHCPYAKNFTETVWKDFADHLGGQKKKTYTARIYMRQIMLRAFHRGVLKQKVQLQNPDARIRVGRVVTPDEIRKLVAAARAKRARLYRVKWRLILRLAERNGMRKNEIQTLEWHQIDFEKKEIHIPAAKAKIRQDRTFRSAKGVLPLLKIWRARAGWLVRPDQRHQNAQASFVFPASTRGQDGATENFNPSWRALKRAAKVACRFHDLRHTAITRTFGRGVPSSKVALYFGVSLKVIEEVYLHGSPEYTAEVAE